MMKIHNPHSSDSGAAPGVAQFRHRVYRVYALLVAVVVIWSLSSIAVQFLSIRLLQAERFLRTQSDILEDLSERTLLLGSLNNERSFVAAKNISEDILTLYQTLEAEIEESNQYYQRYKVIFSWLNPNLDEKSFTVPSNGLTPFQKVAEGIQTFDYTELPFIMETLIATERPRIIREFWRGPNRMARGEVREAMSVLGQLQLIFISLSGGIVILTSLLLFFRVIKPQMKNLEISNAQDIATARIREHFAKVTHSYINSANIHSNSRELAPALTTISHSIDGEGCFTFKQIASNMDPSDQYVVSNLFTDNTERYYLAVEILETIHKRIDIAAYLDIIIQSRRLVDESKMRSTIETERDQFHNISLTALDVFPAPVVAFDKNNRVLGLNNAMREMMDFSDRDHITEKTRADIINTHDHICDHQATKNRNIFEGQGETQQENIVYYQSGKILRWDRSEIEGYGEIYFANDVSKMMDDLAESERKQRLEYLGRIVGTIAHDLNNFFAVIKGSIEVIMDTSIRADQRALLVRALRTADTATMLNRKLLMSTRKKDLWPTKMRFSELADDLQDFIKRMYGGIRFEIILYDNPELFVDRAYLLSSLFNILKNSALAMENSGAIKLTTQVDKSSGLFLIQIEDTGPGFSEKALLRAKDFFYSEGRIGTGMGLASVDSFARLAQGRLELNNKSEGGAAVSLYLGVIYRAPEAPPKPQNTNLPANDADSDTVVLLEDNNDLRSLIAMCLKRAGYHVLPASSVKQGMEIIQQTEKKPAVIVSDLVLPDGDGTTVVKACTDRFKSARVILMSGYTDKTIDTEDLPADVVILEKPIVLKELVARISEWRDEDSFRTPQKNTA